MKNLIASSQVSFQTDPTFMELEKKEFTPPSDIASLEKRKKEYKSVFVELYSSFRKHMAKENLVSKNSWEILKQYTSWMDEWIKFTWKFSYEEKDVLVQEMIRSGDQQIHYLKSSIEKHKKMQKDLKQVLYTPAGGDIPMDPVERAYYVKQFKEVGVRETEMSKELGDLKDILPKLGGSDLEEGNLLQGISVFARGGYGRKELTFSSDIDLGYCIEKEGISKVFHRILRELVKRVQELLQELSLDFASQYFELEEDLSRFTHPATLHTLPSILESRTILGNDNLLDLLKEQILSIVPQDNVIRIFLQKLKDLKPGKNDEFYVKEGYGGLRHIQLSLWLVMMLLKMKNGNTHDWLMEAQKKGWITDLEVNNILLALEFYFDLRNFLGLFDCYHEKLNEIGYTGLIQEVKKIKDFWGDHSCLAYLKLRERFFSVDFLDRFRLGSMYAIADISDKVVHGVLNRNETVDLGGFKVVKYLETDKIVHFDFSSTENSLTSMNPPDEIDHIIWKLDTPVARDPNMEYFLDFQHLFDLFAYIAKTGNQLSSRIKQGFSALIPKFYELPVPENKELLHDFFFKLFYQENASTALRQMVEISSPLTWDGNVNTLLGRFIPEVNQMRYLVRNVTVHQWPLCLHSLRALKQVEIEISEMQKKEPELWKYISDADLFGLKWSTLFHDIGKIDPHRNHENYGPSVAIEMLTRLGWKEGDETLNLVRLLVENHQSVVRYSNLSTYADIGITKFFELAERDPRKVILLYLVNISDFKSVNEEMYRKTGKLEAYFNETMHILDEFKEMHTDASMTDIVNHYFTRKKDEVSISVLTESVLQECSARSIDEALFNPLKKFAPEESEKIEENKKELERAIYYLFSGVLDDASSRKHSIRAKQILTQYLSIEHLKKLVSQYSQNLPWFFEAFPNRYLLSSPPNTLYSQLLEFVEYKTDPLILSYVKGKKGEMDMLLFHLIDDYSLQEKIILALSRRGINIESGKVNRVEYKEEHYGYAGYLQVSNSPDISSTFLTNLRKEILNLDLPHLIQPSIENFSEQDIQVVFYQEFEKGYLVREKKSKIFQRVKTEFTTLKVSLMDAPFRLSKIMKVFDKYGIYPQQVTITTIGKQIVDYFYFLPDVITNLDQSVFSRDIQEFLMGNLSWQHEN